MNHPIVYMLGSFAAIFAAFFAFTIVAGLIIRLTGWRWRWLLGFPLGVVAFLGVMWQAVELNIRSEQRPMEWTIAERTELIPDPDGVILVIDGPWTTYHERGGGTQHKLHAQLLPGSTPVTYKFQQRSVNPGSRWLDNLVERRVILVPPDAKIRHITPTSPIPVPELLPEGTASLDPLTPGS